MLSELTTLELLKLTRKVSPSPDDIPGSLKVKIPQVAYSRISESSASHCEKEKGFVFCSMLYRRRKRLGKLNGPSHSTIEEARVHGVPMSAEILRDVLSRNDTARRLIELEVIKMIKNYSAGHNSRTYWFTDEVLAGSNTSIQITNKKRIKKLLLWRSSQLFRQLKGENLTEVPNGTLIRLLKELSEVELDEKGIQLLDESIDRIGDNAHSTRKIRRYFNTGYEMIFRVSHTGRITSHLTCIPHRIEKIRHHLLHNGEAMVEWDIPSSHVAIILRHFSKEERKSDDFRLIPALMNLSRFYDAYTSTWELDDDGTSSSKKLFQKLINSPRQDWRANQMYRLLRKELPVFVKVLRRLKSQHPGKMLSHYIQGLEAKFVLQVVTKLHKEDIPCYTVYDSIGVPASQAIRARDIFNEELEKFLGFPLRVKTDSPHITQTWAKCA
jgi:hypothetical protein